MKRTGSVAVTSRSFSKHPVLRSELESNYACVTLNEEGRSLAGADLVEFLRGHEMAIMALEKIDNALLDQLPDLKVVSKFGVGLDNFDLAALDRHGVGLAWTGGTNSRSVAELVIAMAIMLLRHIPKANAEVKSGVWRQAKGRCLSGRVVGVIGCGHIGKDLVRLLAPFGCRVLVYDPVPDRAFVAEQRAELVELEVLLSTADVVTLHVPVTDATRYLLNESRLKLMKQDAVLINAARGRLVDERALKERLKADLLAGAAMDVFEAEPPTDQELLNLPNFVATPHIGGSTEEAILNMGRAAIAGLEHPRPAREFMPKVEKT